MVLKVTVKSEKTTDDCLSSDNSDADALNIAVGASGKVKKTADVTSYDSKIAGAEIVFVKTEPAERTEETAEVVRQTQTTNAAPATALSYLTTPGVSKHPHHFLPSYLVPPPMSCFYPPRPVLLPGMMPAPQSAYLAYPPSYFQPPYQFPICNWPVTNTSEGEFNPYYNRNKRESPTDSGVSSSSSPSPTRSSPKNSPGSPKTSSGYPRRRTCYTTQQVRAMQKLFSENQYPSYDVCEEMSADLGIPVQKIKVWFQNRRARCKSDPPLHNNMVAMMPSATGYRFGSSATTHFPPMIPSYPFPVNFPSPELN